MHPTPETTQTTETSETAPEHPMYAAAREIMGGAGLNARQVKALVDLRHLPGVEEGDTFRLEGKSVGVTKSYYLDYWTHSAHELYVWEVPLASATLAVLLERGMVQRVRNRANGGFNGEIRYRLSETVLDVLPWHEDHPMRRAFETWRERKIAAGKQRPAPRRG